MELQERRTRTERLPFEKLLNNNNLGIIENPLRRIDNDDLEKDLRSFYDDKRTGLSSIVDVELLIRGGRLARDEEDFIANQVCSLPERQAIDREKTASIWQESKELRIILLTCFVAAIVQGWAQGAIVGANQSWPDEFGLRTGLSSASRGTGSTTDVWRFSATNAITYFSASTLGAFFCDPLTELVTGRRGALFVSAIFTLAASIGAAYTHSWQALLATRVLLGIGMGAKTSVVPVYESEVAPARLRGLPDLCLICLSPLTEGYQVGTSYLGKQARLWELHFRASSPSLYRKVGASRSRALSYHQRCLLCLSMSDQNRLDGSSKSNGLQKHFKSCTAYAEANCWQLAI